MGQYEEVQLVEGGADIPVTVSNVLRYVTLVANYKLNVETMPQCQEFTGGMQDVLPKNLLGMFAPVRGRRAQTTTLAPAGERWGRSPRSRARGLLASTDPSPTPSGTRGERGCSGSCNW